MVHIKLLSNTECMTKLNVSSQPTKHNQCNDKMENRACQIEQKNFFLQ